MALASLESPGIYENQSRSLLRRQAQKDYYQLWAQYIVKYIKEMAERGIKISAVSIQNRQQPRVWESVYIVPKREGI